MRPTYTIAYLRPGERCPKVYERCARSNPLDRKDLDNALSFLGVRGFLGRRFGSVVVSEGFVTEVISSPDKKGAFLIWTSECQRNDFLTAACYEPALLDDSTVPRPPPTISDPAKAPGPTVNTGPTLVSVGCKVILIELVIDKRLTRAAWMISLATILSVACLVAGFATGHGDSGLQAAALVMAFLTAMLEMSRWA